MIMYSNYHRLKRIKYGLVNGDYWQIKEFNGKNVFKKISK